MKEWPVGAHPPPRLHEHQRSGAVAGEIADLADFFKRRCILRAREKNRARDDQEDERRPQANAQGAVRIGIEATFSVKMSDYKIKGDPKSVADEIFITASLEGMQK